MKTKNIFKGLSLALVAFAALATTSCKDEPDAYQIQGGKPTISFVRPVSASSRDSIITAASMQSTICIVGENLRSVTALLFNDQQAVLNTSYITDNTLRQSNRQDLFCYKQQGYRFIRFPCCNTWTCGGLDVKRVGRTW